MEEITYKNCNFKPFCFFYKLCYWEENIPYLTVLLSIPLNKLPWSYFEAFCHLPSGKTSLGETENITIDHCNTKLCFEHEAIHQTPIGQIQSLKDGSQSCYQEIVYSCKTAPWKVKPKLNLETYFWNNVFMLILSSQWTCF